MDKRVQAVTDADFDHEVLQAELPVLVNFWSPGCAPCRALAPVFDRVAHEQSGKIKCVKANVRDNSQTIEAYGIRGAPTLMFFLHGQPAEAVNGVTARELIGQAIECLAAEHSIGSEG